jgi:hypothetical protein
MRCIMFGTLGRRALLPGAISLSLAASLLLFGCTESPPPVGTSGDGSEQFDGSIDPQGGTFVLQSLESPVPGDGVIRVELLGRNLHFVRERGEVALEIAVRNIDSRTLYGPAEILSFRYRPESVFPANPDRVDCPGDSADSNWVAPDACTFAYSYSALLGADGILLPGETSGFRTWVFQDPELLSFSFGAAARFALNGDQPRIAGLFFGDLNENGVPDPNEGPFGGGWVEVRGPGLDGVTVPVNEVGRYMVRVQEPGSYIVTAYPPPTFGFAPVRFTTPNPLQVVLPPGPNGEPQSFLHADFGITNDLPRRTPPVILYDGPADSLSLDQYHYLEGSLEDSILTLRVGISGCSPEHPLQLYMVGGFMESLPVQARLLLAHDDLGELCDAYFERTLQFNLRPIQEAYRRSYGPEGVILLRFQDWQGEIHTFELGA